MKRYWLSVFFVLGLFWLTRLYKLSDSFFFFNDMGRDFSVLQDFKRTGKPPLLGPQTSALPFNQSAVYFYLLFPMFVLTRESLFSSHYTLILFYSGFFLIGAVGLKDQLKLRKILLLSALLLTITPQVIVQNRFVWNPSFISPLIIAVTLTLMSLIQTYSHKKAIFMSSCLSLALALSYSVAPFFLAVCLVAIWFLRRKSWLTLISVAGSTLFFQIPTLIFELRHNFLLTRALMGDQFLVQERVSADQQLYDFIHYFFTNLPAVTGYLILISLGLLGFFWWRHIATPVHKKQFLVPYLTAGLTLVISLLIKTNIQAHYIFPLASLILITIASLPNKLYILYSICLATYWLSPSTVKSYLSPARHTTKELLRCANDFCQQVDQPIFVAVQAGYHPYHNGPEFRYLFNRSGCTVKNIETDGQAARQLALVIDQSTYEHEKTRFNELTLLGPSDVIKSFTCSSELQILLLQRK